MALKRNITNTDQIFKQKCACQTLTSYEIVA